LALLIAIWLEQRRDSTGDRRRIGGLTGAPILGSVPRGDAAMSIRKPTRRVSESYRLVRTSLEAALTAADAELRTMIVVSAARREGRSTTATHIALALAESGRRVVLVDADMHNPRQAQEFELDNQRGLSNLLHDPDEVLSNVLVATWVPLLSLIPAGPTPAEPSALLSSKRLAEVMVQLRDVCDVVGFDTPPLLEQPDAALLASKVDAVLLVVDVRRSRGRQVRRATDLLNDASSAPIGVVINSVPAQSSDFVAFEGAQTASNNKTARESVATSERHAAPTSMPASASDGLGGE
jgi:capsular exopolysaccharide synthesis family protein